MDPTARPPHSLGLGSTLLLLGGCAALMYETAWTRTFEALLGHTAGTTATVIAGFLAGLAVGALLAGRWLPRLRRPLAVYGAVELAVAGWILVLPVLLAAVDRAGAAVLGRSWAAPGPGDAVRWGVGFLLVMVPSLGMGAAFPLVVAAVGCGRGEGHAAGVLYAADTAGAVLGTVAAGFITVRFVGVRNTLLLGVAAGCVAGCLAILAARRGEGRPAVRSVEAPLPSRKVPPAAVAVVLMLSGMVSLADEVLWLRLFVFPLGGNLLTFATVVGALLLAVAAGSRLAAGIMDSRRAWVTLGWVELVLGAAALGTLAGFSGLPVVLRWAARITGGASLVGSLPGRALLVALLVALPGMAMGAVLPLGVAAAGRTGPAGRASGIAYAALSGGNVVGALLGGYVLLPGLGITNSALAMAALPLGAGTWVLARTGRRRTAVGAAVVSASMLAAAVMLTSPGVVVRVASVRDPHARLLAADEGVQGTVTVSRVPGLPVLAANRPPESIGTYGFPYRLVAVDAVQVAGTAPDLRTTQRLQAHVPLLVHGRARRILQIGYGSGETAAETLLHRPEETTVVELNPDVVRMAERWFPEFVRPGLPMRFTDARLAVRTASERWDVILNDSTYPGMAGSSGLYSLEHFRACRDHLTPGGILSTWVPVDLPPETFRTVLATFSRVFPRCSFWLAPVCLNKHGVLVGAVDGEGSMEPVPEREWPPEVRRSLADLGIRDASALAACRLLDGTAIRRLAEGAPSNSEDHPILEYPARGVRVSGMDLWGETLSTVLPEVRPPAHGAAVRTLLRGQAAFLHGHADLALDLYRRAGELWPQSPWPRNLQQGILVQRAQFEFGRAEAARRRGDLAGAAAALIRCLEREPNSVAAAAALGRILLADGRWAEAAHWLDRARAFAADPEPLELALADALRFAGAPDRAERLYRRALDRMGQRFELLAALSDAVDRQGRLPEAIEIMQRAVRCAPDREEGVTVLAGLLLRARRVEEARQLLSRAVARHPRWRRARHLLARLQLSG